MNSTPHNPIAQAAALPFRIIESLGIACGYERSFKMSPGSLLANRYILGIETAAITRDQVAAACRQLNMPEPLLEECMADLPQANMVFFGFEDGEAAGAIYKVYLEFWDQLIKKLETAPPPHPPHLLHKGFKWQIHDPGLNRITRYQCLPKIGIHEIRERIPAIYQDLPHAAGLDAITSIIDAALRRCIEEQYIYVEITEPGNPRRSFDLNLYPAGMIVGHIARPIQAISTAFNVPQVKLDRLMTMVRNKFFGHISAGISSTGEEYFTVYYEN